LNQFVYFHEIQQGGYAIEVTSTPFFLIPYLKPFQNGRRSNFWDGCKIITSLGTMKRPFSWETKNTNVGGV
jgi:hypothetical protein